MQSLMVGCEKKHSDCLTPWEFLIKLVRLININIFCLTLKNVLAYLLEAEASNDDEEEEEEPEKSRNGQGQVPGVEPALRDVLDLE